MAVIMRWLGNAGFEFQINSTCFLLDPFLTRPKTYQVYFGHIAPDKVSIEKHITHADHILITHTHFDHSMDAPEIARLTGATIHGSSNTCTLMCAAGLPDNQIHQVSARETFRNETVCIGVLPAAHPWIPGYTSGKIRKNLHFPLRLQDYRMDTCYSYLLDSGKIKILVWSSTDTRNAPRADILTCRAVSSQRWYDELLSQVQPNLVIPQHWDNFFQPLDSPTKSFWSAPRWKVPPLERINLKDFDTRIKQAKAGTKVLLPEIFESYDLQTCLAAN